MVSTRGQKLRAVTELAAATQQSIKSAAALQRRQKTISGRVTKPTGSRIVRRGKSSIRIILAGVKFSKLSPKIQQLDYKILRQQKRLDNFTGQYYPPLLRTYDNRYQFKFGHDPFQHIGFVGPSSSLQWEVYELMRRDLKDNFNKDCFLDQPDTSTNELQDGPMHMSDDLSIDNLVKVILSISTENSLAIRQHAQLCSKFTYTVDGNEVRGSIPNYHKMRLCSPEELVKALNVAGHHNIRQRAFHSILQEVYCQNVKRMPPGEVVQEGNPFNAGDFVPGLLSMEYLKGDGLTQQQRFDMLVRYDLIAVKTGCCLLAFNLKIPVFVVDTHVHNMVRSLGWIPNDCLSADKACMFLDSIMDSRLKFGLHQAFWHHRINCVRCMPRANPDSLAYQQRVCPLEKFMRRGLQSIRQASVREQKGTAAARTAQTTTEITVVKKLASSVKFQNMHYTVAEERGYALRKTMIDDDFGDGTRQNKDVVADYYWSMKEFTHANDIVTLTEALEGVGMSKELYEAKFVKKARASPAKKASGPRAPRKPKQGGKKKGAKMAGAMEDSDYDELMGEDIPMADDENDSDYIP